MSRKDQLRILLPHTSLGIGRQPMALRAAEALAAECSEAIGSEVKAEFVHLDPLCPGAGLEETLLGASGEAEAVFMLPAEMHIDLFVKRALADAAVWARKKNHDARIFYDGVEPCHPLLLASLADAGRRAAMDLGVTGPGQFRLLLAASGDGDPEVRAESYKLMRLLWEEIGAATGEIGFVRHGNPMLAPALKRFAAGPLPTIVAAQYLWPCEHRDFAETMVGDISGELGRPIPLTVPIGDHPNVGAWFRQRAMGMWWDYRLKTQRPAIKLSEGLSINTKNTA
ncbi:hypothetical protein BerOc1_02852 [Pseudodesulfovibrio hydrargyri]|uniref:Sirohydrochlorin cobaltochelatase n=1 Tax=Pseudodesulfovibrio hydrargyri TaxID=2125990 RepID=A0A1J5MWK2_9BACT|nr:hypothetical protein [Pseudodesulfovibrio hydrargyri]OIQ50910.1 hypothetical protein BerOc1_02852 [Pseudodesulfovibrio hydrargyri]